MVDIEKISNLLDTVFVDAGDNWKACCPFHEEKTPSFYIHKEDLICHCFGCGAAGSLATVVARKTQTPVADVRATLNLNIVELAISHRSSLDLSPRTYPKSWLAPWKRISNHPYLEQRGFTNETIEHFEARWDPSTRRVVFPMWCKTELRGAAGRATDGRDPKWFFYWNCQKSKQIWPDTIPESPVIVVEGMFDVMWLWQHGHSAVSIQGSKPSKEQISQIKNQASSVIIMLDNDEAGRLGEALLEDTLRDSCTLHYVKWPAHANDAMDLSAAEIDSLLEDLITPVERKLHAAAI